MPRKKARIQKSDNISNISSVYSTENQENNGVEIPTIRTVFKESEDSHAHDRLISYLKIDFYDKLNINEFCEDFFTMCRCIILSEDRSKTDLPLKFVVKFIIYCIIKAEDDNTKEKSLKLLKRFIKFMTWHHDLQEAHSRFHVVRAIKILLNELTDDIEIPDMFYEKIQDALVKRFWDTKSFIRAETAQASSRLQSPSDADCVIVISLIHLCKYDSSHTVRLAAMQALAITTKTLPVIITRCRDVSDLVRKKSYELLIKWKILKPLTVSKRLQIMETGLTDKSEIVRRACIELLKVWLSASNNDPVVLLKRLDVENMEESTELTLKTLLNNSSELEIQSMVDTLVSRMDDKRLVSQSLDSETAFFWRHLVQHFSDKQEEYASHLEKIVPAVPDFEVYLRGLLAKPTEQSQNQEVDLEESVELYTILKHLLPIVRFMDIFDEHNRLRMINLVRCSLSSSNIPFNYVEHLMKLLVHLESNNEKICNLTVELINELLFPEIDLTDESSAVISSDHTIGTEQSLHGASVVQTPLASTDPTIDPTVINREAIRKNRIEMIDVEVRINELNESISNRMQNKIFDNIEQLIGDLKQMNEKKQALVDQNNILSGCPNNNAVKGAEAAGVTIEKSEPVELADMTKAEVKECQAWMGPGMEYKLIKSHVMTIAMIQECNLLWSLPPSLRTLFDNVILLSVQHSDLFVRQKAILSMGLCCLLDKDLAIQYYRLFMQSLLIDHATVKEISLRSLIDIFIRFGIEPFQDDMMASKESSKIGSKQSERGDDTGVALKAEHSFISDATVITEEDYNKCTTELMTPIIDLLNSENTEIQSTVAIGLSKLLYNHKLMSSKLLSRLLLLWFNPITEDNVHLRQYLAAFFTNFAFMSSDNQDAIANCFPITVRTLCRAPSNSPLVTIEINNVVGFFERVTNSKNLITNRTNNVDQSKLDNPCHDNLAIILSNQILNAPLAAEIKFYVPMLLRLRLSPNNVDIIKLLEPMVATMIQKIKDRKLVLSLEKFYTFLNRRLEEIHQNEMNASSVLDETLVENPVINDTFVETPVSKPSLLELGSDGKKMNTTYIGRNVRVNQANNGGTHQMMNPVDIDDSAMDTTVTDSQSQQSTLESASAVHPDISKLSLSTDDQVFKKPSNMRVTRSATRPGASCNSSISSISSDVSTSTRLPGRTPQRKK